MENTKKNYSMKSKLISAIAMLLVATIMLVSSTYAWFTLSTKPEVSGISTAIGANGALEIALATQDDSGVLHVIETDASAAQGTARNNYWGNLVDLSDASYGSDSIVLYPAVLNINDIGNVNLEVPVRTPKYGADGRVESVEPSGMFAMYDPAESAFLKTDNYGFRAIGNASGMSPRQQAFRVAMSEIMVKAAAAQTKARNSLNANGDALAAIAIKRGMSNSDSFGENDIAAVGSMISGLEEAIAAIEDAYLEIIYTTTYGENDLDDKAASDAVTAAKAAAAAESTGALGAKITAVVDELNEAGATVNTSILNGYAELKDVIAAYNQASANYDLIKDKTQCTWSELSAALRPLVNTDMITINGYTTSEAKDSLSEIASAAMGDGINVVIPTGGGVYADIADYAGDYTVSITINIDAEASGGLELKNLPAKMKTQTEKIPSYLAEEKTRVSELSPQGDSTKNAISEFYGYAIDLAFRTNASASNLLLKTTPADRIYDDNQNEDTMGKGSTMTFHTADTSFTDEKMLNLMSKLKVVFYETSTGKILANAKLNTEEGVEGSAADGLTANLFIVGEDNAFKAESEATILELAANQAHYVTALVYLDGENISNADVAAIATDARSMTGTFNLQFASSATLKPMEYSDLHTAAPSNP